MAIPKKGSRIVTVHGVPYRWRIRQKPTHSQSDFASPFSVAVERIDPPSVCTLLLAAPFPRPDNALGYPSTSITPQIIATSIESALAQGWHPDQPGSAFTHVLHTNEKDPR